MHRPPRSIPNPLTALRVVLLVPLWWLALLDQQTWLAAGLAAAALTDAFDGRLAKRYRGSQMAASTRSPRNC